MSVAHIGKRQENTAALCRKISQNVGWTYQEASGETVALCKWLRNSPSKRYQKIRICLTGEVETPSSPIRRQARFPDVKTFGWNVGGAEFRMCCPDHLLSLATSFRQPAITHIPSPSDGVSGRPVRTSFVGIPKNSPQSRIVLVVEETQTILVLELLEDDNSLFESIVSPVEEVSNLYSLVSCNSISISAPHSPTPQIFDIDDEIAQLDLDIDSFDHDSDPIDERVSLVIGDVETVDFGIEDQPRELKIGSPLSIYESDRLIHLLTSYLDVFAWSYEDMSGLNPSIVKEEIKKQLNVGFISMVEYPEWLANIVPIPKKDDKVRVCVDFRDFNKTNLKDDFPFPQIDFLVNNTVGHSMLFFMDGFSGIMPFGLKNARATYQRATTTLFHDMRHRVVEVYVDDMIVKSRGRADHLLALEREFY
ncbi:Transposon Ty3-G Gag-Pol polyprotein [Vitis vinifera]|uniref:Transposon Ty3-G Gag-Pol polyprotein n=1 Tax=Vitis vinifera TaxID=29760 RepID=A0A438G8B0_VITVI|nr:Transposon Ty3-G Gag-Pol polyprotein [Vitis vinifera]